MKISLFYKAMTKKILNAKVACLDFGLMKARMKLGVQIVVDDPNKLDAIRERFSIKKNSTKIKLSYKL